MPKISVIVPVYKVEKYLHRCIDSILAQTFEDFELILVDDGSPDKCGQICDEYSLKDSRVHVIHQENGGLAAARNSGLKKSLGEYIAFVDSDDWIDKAMLEKMYMSIQSCDAELVITDFYIYSEEHIRAVSENSIDSVILTSHEALNKLVENCSWIYAVAWNKLYKRELFDNISFPEGYVHEDSAIVHRIFGKCKNIVCISDKLYFYHQREDSITGIELNITRTDELTALSDRIIYAHEIGMYDLRNKTVDIYIEFFWNIFSVFVNIKRNEKYYKRVRASLHIVLPYVIKSSKVTLGRKIRMLLFYINPRWYRFMSHFIDRYI